ncbi:response regulator [Paenibacillus hodogayensis]|uniref:Response regulator n=1 Tax=Paenibacillus hodogayensis TaxID=279208 RepID=A0ABV5VVF0_9BACL
MYKLFIVDDNPRDRGGVAGLLDWGSMGLRIVGIFPDGAEAFREAERECPDIVLTDVQMPGMDGLELGRRIKERYPATKLIFMSGHDDFAYAKSALQLDAENYVLKPIRKNELREAVAKAADKLSQERTAMQEKDELQQQIKRSLPLHQDRFVRELLFGSFSGMSGELLRKRMELLEIRLPADGHYRVLLLQTAGAGSGETEIPDYVRLMHHLDDELSALRDQPPGLHIRMVPLSDRQLAFIAGSETAIAQSDMKALDWVLQAEERMDESLQHVLSIGISRQGRLADLPKLYAQSARALEAKVYSDRTPRIMFYEEIDESEESPGIVTPDADEWLQDIRELLFSEKAPAIEPLLDRYLSGSGAPLTDRELKPFLLLLSGTLQRIYVEAGKSVNGLIILFLSLWNKLETATGLNDIRTAVDQLIGLARSQLVDEQRPYYDQVVKDIKRIVMKRYMDPITIQEIADDVFLSLSHANNIFKNKTGRKIFDYLTEYRMEKAKSLLREPGSKIYLVAQQVGYTNKSHFCLIFKKYSGLTPSEYKNRSE